MSDPYAHYQAIREDPPRACLLVVTETGLDDAEATILARLREAGFEVRSLDPGAAAQEVAWLLEVDLPGGAARLAPDGPPNEYVERFELMHPELMATVAARGRDTLALVGPLGDPFPGFHAMVRCLHAAWPDPLAWIDLDSLGVHPPERMTDLATSSVPPSPEFLFQVHAVNEGPGERSPLWLHTHGLARCGTIELDIAGVQVRDVEVAGQVINTAAAFMLEEGPPPPDTPFEIVYGVPLVWFPWEDGVRILPRGAFGGSRDREDDEHRGARGLLFVPKKGLFGGVKPKPLSAARGQLAKEPMFYLSTAETGRRAALARERLPRMRALFERYGDLADDWGFMMKLGFDTPDGGAEHLFFHVHAIDDAGIEATCVNDPHLVDHPKGGERGHFGLDRLSDWTIYCEHGSFGPDTIGSLETITRA